jgi:cold shock CspA family protein
MPLTGTLRSWNEDRGFGFIAPAHGGRELFVHISAFPRDGSRPTIGEVLTYELGEGKDGKPQAIRAHRTAVRHVPASSRRGGSATRCRTSPILKVVAMALALAIGYFAFPKYQQASGKPEPQTKVPAASLQQPYDITAATGSQSRCDGRKYCSQMTSCTEAKYFLKNCPGVEMDGNHDGVPCEQQWCTSPFAK